MESLGCRTALFYVVLATPLPVTLLIVVKHSNGMAVVVAFCCGCGWLLDVVNPATVFVAGEAELCLILDDRSLESASKKRLIYPLCAMESYRRCCVQMPETYRMFSLRPPRV